jgi:hypothetical protein
MSGEFLSGNSHVVSCPRPAWVVSRHLLHDPRICKSFFQSARAFFGEKFSVHGKHVEADYFPNMPPQMGLEFLWEWVFYKDFAPTAPGFISKLIRHRSSVCCWQRTSGAHCAGSW